MKPRTNPYGQALTLDEWRHAQANRQRPLTDDPMHTHCAARDARLSRLVQPTPRTGAQRQADHRARKREDAA